MRGGGYGVAAPAIAGAKEYPRQVKTGNIVFPHTNYNNSRNNNHGVALHRDYRSATSVCSFKPRDVQVNRITTMEQLKSIQTTVVYASINGGKMFLNLADDIIGKRKNNEGDIVTSEAPIIGINVAYIMKQLIAFNKGVASACRRSDNASSTLCATIEGAEVEITPILHKAGETYNEGGDILEFDKYEYNIVIKKLDDDVITFLKTARAKDFGC